MGRKYHRVKRGYHKYKLLLDENFLDRLRLPLLNSRYDIKHIKHDFGLIGLTDPEVHAFAVKKKRIIVTFNDKDFKNLATKSKLSGVIGISSNMTADHIDKKLASLLKKAKPGEIYAKFLYISEETET